MRRRRPGARRLAVLLLLAVVVVVLGVGPAAGEEPLRLVDLSPPDQHVVAVVDVPGSQTPGAPSPEFEVLDGESRLAVEGEPVLQPRRSLTVVVDAAGAGPATGLAELAQVATDLLLRLSTTVQPALVISRAGGPEVLPPGGVTAAVEAVGGLRPGARSGDALPAAVRAAVAGSGEETDGPRVVVVLAASGGEVPAARLREELSGQQALVHVLALGATAQQYWREVVPGGAGEVAASGSGLDPGSVVRRLASQHVVSFRKPRDSGSVVLLARAGDRALTATIDLGSTREPAAGQVSGSKRAVVIVIALLALSVVSVLLLVMAARDRRVASRLSARAGAERTGAQHLRSAPGRSRDQATGRHHRDRQHDAAGLGEWGTGQGPPSAAPAGQHSARSSPRRSAPPSPGPQRAGARGRPGGSGPIAGRHVRGLEDVPAHGPADLRPGTDPALAPEAGADRPDPPAATPTAGAPAAGTCSSDAASPSRWAAPPAVPRQRRSASADGQGRATPPDSAPPSDGGPGPG